MGAPAVGDVVVLPFPFSDLSDVKKRPAMVVALASGGDVVLCQITSQPYAQQTAIALHDSDFSTGGLNQASYARPDKLFTASPALIIATAGHLSENATSRVRAESAARFRP